MTPRPIPRPMPLGASVLLLPAVWAGALLVLSACLAPPPAIPAPPSVAVSTWAALARAPRVPLPGKTGLSILVPEGYVLKTETGATPEIHHVWRRELSSLAREVSLHIVIAPFRLPQCPDAERVLPPRSEAWTASWHVCDTSAAGVQARESFLPLPGGRIVQLAVVGAPGAEADRLQDIAETLRPQ